MPEFSVAEVKSTLVAQRSFPVDVIVEPIAVCNLNCIMCPQPHLQRARGEMDFAVFKRTVDEVARESPSSRLWLALMGETLLLGDKLIEFIRYAKDQGLEHVNLNTNASLMDQAMAGKLVDSGVDEIIVGLDAFTASTYQAIRVNGDFVQTVKNVEYLLSLIQARGLQKPAVIMQFIVMDENEAEVDDFKDYWLRRGAVVKIRPRLGWGTGVEAGNLQRRGIERDFPCPWLNRTVSIHWSGKFAQCDGDFEGRYSPGDVRTQTIKEVWDGELAGRRARHLRGDFSHELCAKCFDWAAGRSEFHYPGRRKP